jgi:hypothetical protein
VDATDSGVRRGFPNPVYLSRDVSIPFAAEDGAISVFDIRGRVVTRLGDSGRDSAWDLRDADGNLVAPGIYFLHFDARDRVATRKIVILK